MSRYHRLMPVESARKTAPEDAVIAADCLTKVFGPEPNRALPLLSSGETKPQVFEQTGLTVAVDRVCFRVRQGEIFVVMGVSGCGKSTLLRLINGLAAPTSGSVRVMGRDVGRMRPRELVALRRGGSSGSVAMVFESFALLPHLNVLDNAAFGLNVAGISRTERRRRGRSALAALGMQDKAEAAPSELSSGEQQRVGLARALAVEPAVILMDEPFSALDPISRNGMQRELHALQRARGLTIMFVSHDLDEAVAVGDRIAMMDAGRIVQIGTPDAIVDRPASDEVASFVAGQAERSHRPAPAKTDKL